MKAFSISEHTLIGVGGDDFPLSSGNCFSVEAEDRKYYRIINFVLENLEEAIKRGIDWPIEIKILRGRIAVIHDSRIPDSWYSTRFCEVCTPKDMLPLPQLLAHERQIARGERIEREGSTSIIVDKIPML